MADNMMAREQLEIIARQWVEAGWQKGDTQATFHFLLP